MAPERTKFCDLCKQDLKPRGWSTHRKACEKKAEKQRQNQLVAESIRREDLEAEAGMSKFNSFVYQSKFLYLNRLIGPSNLTRHRSSRASVNDSERANEFMGNEMDDGMGYIDGKSES
jgi:hypothetical protein